MVKSKERVWKLHCVQLFSLPNSCWDIGKNFYFEFASYQHFVIIAPHPYSRNVVLPVLNVTELFL